MNTSRVEAFMRAILAASKALGTGPPPEEKTDNVAVLSDLLAQREEMFQFDVLERAYNRQLMRLDNLGNRVGVLLAAQIAIASVLISNTAAFTRWPAIILLAVAGATGVLFGAVGEPDFIRAKQFVRTFHQQPRATRNDLIEEFPRGIEHNRQVAKTRLWIFRVTLVRRSPSSYGCIL